jgi:hypothetical protein
MSIIDYLYKGAAPGERVATQKAVQNMPYSQIGKNIIAEGAFGKGSNLRGFDPNFKGGTNLFNYLKGGVTSLFGGKAAGNIGGGTPAQRQLFEKVASSPFSKTMGTAAKTAFSLPMTAGPTGAYAMYQMNKPSTPAGYDYVRDYDRGSITNAADAENALDYQNFSTGMMNADKNYPGITGVNLEEEEFNPTQYSALQDIENRNKGVPQDSRFSGIMRNVARGPLFQGGAMAGNAIGSALGMANPLFALAGGIGSQFLNLGRSKPDMDYQYVNDPNNMGGLSVVDNKIQDPTGILQGKNFESGYGSKNLGEMYDKALGKNEGYLEGLGGIGELTEEELAALGLTPKQMNRRNALLDKRGLITNRRQDLMYSGEMIPGTNMTRNQFADQYNTAQDNIGSNYDQLDTQSYTGSTASGGLGGGTQADGSYNDPYDPGTDD